LPSFSRLVERQTIGEAFDMVITMTAPRSEVAPAHVNPILWNQSIGYARQACARIFRDGGTPADAMKAFGLESRRDQDWSRTVEKIAEHLSASSIRRAA
jgi:hypothetical protein